VESKGAWEEYAARFARWRQADAERAARDSIGADVDPPSIT